MDSATIPILVSIIIALIGFAVRYSIVDWQNKHEKTHAVRDEVVDDKLSKLETCSTANKVNIESQRVRLDENIKQNDRTLNDIHSTLKEFVKSNNALANEVSSIKADIKNICAHQKTG